MGGDLRPPLVPNVFLQHVQYSWTEIDWGTPSVYLPRILDPLLFLMTGLQSAGVNAYTSELMATFVIYFFVEVLVYLYVKRLTDGDVLAAFVAALFFTSSIHLIVDREQTAIGFIDMSLMILPCLVAFIDGLKKKSLGIMTISGILFVLTYAAFPNYRATVLCSISLLVTLLFMYINKGTKVGYNGNGSIKFFTVSFNWDLVRKYAKCLLAFGGAALFASIWVITLVSANFNSFLMAYNQVATIPYGLYIKAHDVLRLIAKWSFYTEALGRYYTPYAVVYLNNPGVIVLSYIPTILAFVALFVSKSRRLAILFGLVAVLFLALTGGFAPLPNTLYSILSDNLPLMKAFREPTNWIFLVLLSYGILIGLAVSVFHRKIRNGALRILVLLLTMMLFFSISYPLFTGEVTENWLAPETKGSYFPSYFNEVENAISSQYWTILLPQKQTYAIYNFTDRGILAVGNPYPLIFSKPILSGSGTEYIQSQNMELLNKVYELMLTSKYENVAPEGRASTSSVENKEHAAASAVDGDYNTRWASEKGMPQWFEINWKQTQELSKIRIVFENARANDYTIETWNGFKWTTQIKVESNILLEPEYVFPQVIPTTRLRITFTQASPFNLVSIWELEALVESRVPKLLGVLGIKNLILEKNIISGNVSAAEDYGLLTESLNFTLIHEWDGASLYENAYAVEKFYPASNISMFSDFVDLYQFIGSSAWSTLQHSALINSTSDANWASIKMLQTPESFSWKAMSPTSYKVNAKSDGQFLLVFSESYDTHWKAIVNGKPIPENNHVMVNGFGNGWLISSAGNLTITVEYETQNLITTSIVVSVVLSAVLAIVLTRKTLEEVIHSIRSKFKARKS
jgi:hypothetical protein